MVVRSKVGELRKEMLELLNEEEKEQVSKDDESRKDMLHELAIEVVDGEGFEGQSPDADNSRFEFLMERLTESLEFVPGHWRRKRKGRPKL